MVIVQVKQVGDKTLCFDDMTLDILRPKVAIVEMTVQCPNRVNAVLKIQLNLVSPDQVVDD
ncbi:MAG: hypothetical protein OXE87_06220 [Chloroflexi bacterium]|nr:hypothetical protein [Chloroflexota bacterium]